MERWVGGGRHLGAAHSELWLVAVLIRLCQKVLYHAARHDEVRIVRYGEAWRGMMNAIVQEAYLPCTSESVTVSSSW